MSLYWRFRAWLWDRRDARFVARALDLSSQAPVVYIHGTGESAAGAVLVSLEQYELVNAPMNHSHVEGKG